MRKTQLLMTLSMICTSLFGQVAGIDTVNFRYVRDNGDTVVMTRVPGDWRIGPMISGTYHYHFGNLNVPANLFCPSDGYLQLQSGGIGGGGMGIGGIYVYHPAGERWGVSCMVSIFDIRRTTSVTRIPFLPINPSFELDNTVVAQHTLLYVTFMPQARYNYTDYPGLHFLIGLDVDVLTGKSLRRLDVRYHDERIDVQRTVPYQPNYLRVGGHIGAGWDFVAGILGDWRMTLTPYSTMHLGTAVHSRNNSNWNSVYLRAGVTLTFGKDTQLEHILPRDFETPERVPQLITKVEKIVAEYEGQTSIPIDTLSPTFLPIDNTQLAPSVLPEQQTPFLRTIPNQIQVFSGYTSPFDISLTPELRSYLDAVVEYLRQNPRAEVRIIGHADNSEGTSSERQRVSDERALQVVRHLMSKGISRERLLASGMGDRNPIRSNLTPQGRAANRRVEVTIVQP